MSDDIVAMCVILFYVITSDAVRELRKTLGESQQAFSNRLGLSISSITHYEGGQRAPDYAVTLKLYRAACDAKRKDLAAFFLQMVNTSTVARAVVPVSGEEERIKIRALQSILNDSRFAHLRKPLAKLLAPVEKHIRESEAFQRVETADIPGVAEQMIKLQQDQRKGKK
jgi:transcriptional regulator with XRE-family HTH domain